MSSGFLKSTIEAGRKLTFKDFFILGALSAILTRTFRVSLKKRRDKKKLKLKNVSVPFKIKKRKNNKLKRNVFSR